MADVLPGVETSEDLRRLVVAARACGDADPDLFYSDELGDRSAAKRLCAACPAMMACRVLALATGERHGVWGGLDADERRAWARGVVAGQTAGSDAGS